MIVRRRETSTVEETPWWLEVNGERVARGTATPSGLERLAAGRLLVEGEIMGVDDLMSLTVVDEPPGCAGLRAIVPAERAAAAQQARAHRERHGCGERYFLTCAPESLTAGRPPETRPNLDIFPDLFRTLYASAEAYGRTGGMHSASLTDGTELLYRVDDVGRHSAVDKAIGWAVLERADRSALGLLLSARVSAAIAVKAARAGLAWVASRSIPTDLAVEKIGRAHV